MKTELNSPPSNSLISDIFSFAWIPIQRGSHHSEYKDMGIGGSLAQMVVLIVFNSAFALVGLVVLLDNSRYIDLGSSLANIPFNLGFLFLALVFFLINAAIQFFCFRMVSGKGNLVAHGYLMALASTNYILLVLLAVGPLFLINIRGIENLALFVMGIGGIYLIIPSIMSLKGLHRVSYIRTIIGFVLSTIVTVPFFVLYEYLINFLLDSYPYQLYHWPTMIVFSGLLFVGLFMLAYFLLQQDLENGDEEIVSVREPLEKILKIRWVKLPLGIILFFLVAFIFIEIWFSKSTVDLLPDEASILVPGLFIIIVDVIYTYWELKLFFAKPENNNLKISFWRLLEAKRERAFVIGLMFLFAFIYLSSFVFGAIANAVTAESNLAEDSLFIPLDFKVIDAEYSINLDRIVMISTNPNRLHIFDPGTQDDRIIDLSYEPTSVSVDPGGDFAAIGHDKFISYINLNSGKIEKILSIDDEVFEVVLGSNGWVYALLPNSPDVNERKIYAIEIDNDSRLTSNFSYQGSKLRYNPEGQILYGATQVGTSLDSILKITTYNGEPENIGQPFADYSVCNDLWLSEDGSRIFSASGNVFIAASDPSLDMKYVTSLSQEVFPGPIKKNGESCEDTPLIFYLADSTEAKRALAIIIPERTRPRANFAENISSNQLAVIDTNTLSVTDIVTLPNVIKDGFLFDRDYDSNGRFVFFNAAGTQYYVITQADKKAHMPNDFSLLISDLE